VRRAFRHLTNTHLAHHGLTAETYKQSFGYNGGRSLMGHEVRRHHAGRCPHATRSRRREPEPRCPASPSWLK